MPQFAGTGKPPLGIVYDSDLGATIDSVLALAMLHGLEGKRQVRTASLTIANPSLKAAQLCDVIESFYASAVTGEAAIFFSRAAIGLSATGRADSASLIATALLDRKDDNGKPIYSPHIRSLNQTAIPEILIRNALTAQFDHGAVVVLAGPATNLVRLLDLTGAHDLVESKVKFLVFSDPDTAALADAPASKRLFAEWPTPIVTVGRDVGDALPFPGSSIESDFAYAPAHPVAAAYRAYRPMPYDAPAPAMAAVLYASHPAEHYFAVSGQRLVADPSRKEEILKLYTTLASAKPVMRGPRFGAAANAAKAADQTKDETKGEIKGETKGEIKKEQP